MSKVKVLYVRNLTQEISEEKLKEAFEQYGKVERVKKIKDYAFVHFEDRDHAVLAMRGLDGKEIGCANIEVRVRVRKITQMNHMGSQIICAGLNFYRSH